MFYKVCKWLIIIWTVLCAIGVAIGLTNVASISTTNEFESAGVAIGTAVGLGFWFFLWFAPTAVLGVLMLLFRPKAAVAVVQPMGLCPHCGKYHSGTPVFCPHCVAEIDNKPAG